jgi:hypothetical protein
MMANIHQDEIIMDAQSSNILRKYGIPTSGSADNRETVSELKETNKQLAASVRVLQEGFNKLIAISEKTADNTEEVATKTKLQNQAPLATAA